MVFTGERCDQDINECDPNPCENGGECNDNVDYYTCDCEHLYVGVNCSHHVCDNPGQVQCKNGGTCIKDAVGSCACPPGYTGKSCEHDLCGGTTCFHGGLCKEGKCMCPDGFKGMKIYTVYMIKYFIIYSTILTYKCKHTE